MLKPVAIYARISTAAGRQNLDNQLRQLRAYAKRQKWKIVAEFTDKASGKSTLRPGLDALFAAAVRKPFDEVLIFDLSRLTRGGVASAFKNVERLKLLGVGMWSMTQEYFRTAIYGDLLLAIAAYIAEQEREQLVTRVKAGMERAAAAGKKFGRPRKDHIDDAELLRQRRQGRSYRELQELFSIGKATIQRKLQDAEQKEIIAQEIARQKEAEPPTAAGSRANRAAPKGAIRAAHDAGARPKRKRQAV